jgi:hypothetical protein
MSKKETAMQELIRRLEAIQKIYPEDAVLNVSLIIAHQLLEKEKSDIVLAYERAMGSMFLQSHIFTTQSGYVHKAEHYYNETYGGIK